MPNFSLRAWLWILLVALTSPGAAAQTPLRVFLRGGPKTHGPGEHDHPAFVAEWKPLLEARGAKVAGGLEFPTQEQLAATDVLVLFAAEGGAIHGSDRDHLSAFLARGGGIVAIHDAVCGDDPDWFKTVIGGAWRHGHAKWATGVTDLYVRDFEHPITAGVANWRFEDELYTELDMQPDAHILMAGFQDVFSISPQMWTYEKDNYRAFVSIQGHYKKSFEHDAWRTLLLRGIAWTGKREVDLFTTEKDRDSLSYPTGGPLRPEAAVNSLVLHKDFSASLVAAEPLIVNPISIEWDAAGRMWIAETPGYPHKQEFSKIPAHDTISVLEDTDGDVGGVARVFEQALHHGRQVGLVFRDQDSHGDQLSPVRSYQSREKWAVESLGIQNPTSPGAVNERSRSTATVIPFSQTVSRSPVCEMAISCHAASSSRRSLTCSIVIRFPPTNL
jgi:type 1 glutamine amidotransferase